MVIGQHDPGFGLGEKIEQGGVGRVAAGLLRRPGDGRHLLLEAEAQQAVVGRMELHLVDPGPVAVEGVQFRGVAVGEIAKSSASLLLPTTRPKPWSRVCAQAARLRLTAA